MGGTAHVSESIIGPSFLGLDFALDLVRARLEPYSLASLSALGGFELVGAAVSENITLY